jgi:Fe-S-cluster-containing hydrogenase component 2
MKSTLPNKHNAQTSYMQLNTQACKACWDCIDVCTNKVIDKSFLYIANILIHEHAQIYDADKCTGCLRCMEACKFDAIGSCNQKKAYTFV